MKGRKERWTRKET